MSSTLKGEYVSFATRKHSGDWVNTPVWFAPDDHGRFYIFSEAQAGKVKRLRNYTEVRVADCTVTGRVLADWVDGQGTILETKEDIDKAYKALYNKYGWKMRGTDFMSKLAGKYHKRSLLAFTLDAGETG